MTIAGIYNLNRTAPELTDSRLDEWARLASRASTGPWRIDLSKNVGNNWLVAEFGGDDDGHSYIVTTDNVHASELEGHGAKADAEFVAAARVALPVLIEAVRVYRRLINLHPPRPEDIIKYDCAASAIALSTGFDL
jgi:hypothetical protein